MLPWAKLSPEEVAGVRLNQKVLTRKWYIQSRDVTAKGQPSFLTEEVHPAEIGLPEITPREEQVHAPTGKWGPSWSDSLPNSWFTDRSSVTESGLSKWRAIAFRPRDTKLLKLTGRSKSAQHAELIVAVLAVRHSLGEKQKVIYIFTDSWTVANGITIWSQKWAKTDFQINGKAVWSRDYWLELFEASKTVNIYVTHVSAHQKDDSKEATFNNIADRLTRVKVPKRELPKRKENCLLNLRTMRSM